VDFPSVSTQLVRRSRRYLPHVARLCLVSTFIEDGFRLITQWSEQVDYIKAVWHVPSFFAALFILANIILQFVGSGFVLSRYQVNAGVAVLMSTVLIQTIGYNVWTQVFLMRNLSLIGSLLLILAEAQQEAKRILAGLPSSGENAPRQYLLLGGRILIILMFVTLIHLGGSLFYLIQVRVLRVSFICHCDGKYLTVISWQPLNFVSLRGRMPFSSNKLMNYVTVLCNSTWGVCYDKLTM
ncbi:SURF4 family protein, partial [Opisthorchis viverrini]